METNESKGEFSSGFLFGVMVTLILVGALKLVSNNSFHRQDVFLQDNDICREVRIYNNDGKLKTKINPNTDFSVMKDEKGTFVLVPAAEGKSVQIRKPCYASLYDAL